MCDSDSVSGNGVNDVVAQSVCASVVEEVGSAASVSGDLRGRDEKRK